MCPSTLKCTNVTFRIDGVHRLLFTNVRSSLDSDSLFLV